MKITTKKSIDVPLKTLQDFARAVTNSSFQTTVRTITTAAELAALTRALNSKSRPFAVGIVEAKQ